MDFGNGYVVTNAHTFNGTVPGPEFRFKVDDRVIVHLTNNLEIPTSIHWHGVELTNSSDGTGLTQDQVAPNGGTFDYEFIVPRAGVFFYHSHIMPTNPGFKGYFGPIFVADPADQKLVAKGVLPNEGNTKTMILGDVTVCKEPGSNDTATFPADTALVPTVPWAGGSPFPGKLAQPTPATLCDTPLDDHGNVAGAPLPAGSIPNIQPKPDCGAAPICPTNEGQLVLRNGRVTDGRAGSPEAPGALAAGARTINVKAGEGVRLHLASGSALRYFRLKLTDQDGDQVTLFRVGGEGGLLDNVRVEGGTQGTLDTKYDHGEILLAVSNRADVVFIVPEGNKGDVFTLWTLDYQRTGGGQGNAGFSALPTVPVAHFEIVGNASKNARFLIEEGDPLRTHPAVAIPVENIKDDPPTPLLDPATFTVPELGSANETIELTAAGKPGIELSTEGVLVGFDEGVPIGFENIPHIGSSRYAVVGDLLELTIKNTTAAHHPWHPHGFSMQPVRFLENAGNTSVYEFGYQEFVDTIDVPAGHSLVYRVRLDDRPLNFSTPTGGAVGRWAMHCHILFHAGLGMITELVVLPAP